MKWIWLAVLGAVASGCAYESGYYERSYYPQQAEAAPPVSTYSIPANDPKGSVHVMSLGAEQLPVAAGQPSSYLHLRIAPENRTDDVAWTVDPNEQLLAAGGASLSPSFAETSAGTPVLTLAKGAHGYMDLFYAAPAVNTRVSIAWKIRRGTELASGSTDFDKAATTDQVYTRYEATNPNVYVGVGLGWWWPSYGWGYGAWGDPWYWGGYYPYYGRGFYGGYYGRGFYGGHPYYGGRAGYYGGRGGYYGGHGYSGGRVYVPSSGSWRGGGGYHGGGGYGGGAHAAPSGGGGWRGGGGRR